VTIENRHKETTSVPNLVFDGVWFEPMSGFDFSVGKGQTKKQTVILTFFIYPLGSTGKEESLISMGISIQNNLTS